MATVNSLFYKEIATISSLIEGISLRGRKLVEFKLSRLLENENLIAEDRFRSLNEMAEAYHLRTEILAEIYDFLRENAH